MHIVRRRRSSPHIGMTPMIDCVFQLLIFFMLTSSMSNPVLQLVLPEASSQDEVPPPEILVTIDVNGVVYVNDRRIDPDDLERELRSLVAQSQTRVVTFRGDEQLHYRWFVRVLDAARASGAHHLDIEHEVAPRR